MTGSTKSSKAKAYADTAVKAVSKQYLAELEKFNSENRRLMALLDSRNVTQESAKEATAPITDLMILVTLFTPPLTKIAGRKKLCKPCETKMLDLRWTRFCNAHTVHRII